GDVAAAEKSLRSCYEMLASMGERAFLSTTMAFLARAVYLQGRVQEAERLANGSAELAAHDDVFTQVLWRAVRARILSERHQPEAAESLARQAVGLASTTDFLDHQADTWLDLGQVLHASQRRSDAAEAMATAHRLYEQKGNVVSARSALASIDEL